MTFDPQEIAAAQAVKFAQMLVNDAERNSMPDKFKALKIRLATLSGIADSILASGPWEIINHWPPE